MRPRNAKWREEAGRMVMAWIGQNLQALVSSAGQMFRNPLASLLTTTVIGISLALPAAFYLALVNAERVTAGWSGNARITVFLKLDVSEAEAGNLARTLATNAAVADVRYISPAEALAEFRRSSGFGDTIEQLGDNPLPGVLLVQPREIRSGTAAVEALLVEIRALPQTDAAQFDRQWVQRLVAMINVLQRAVLILAALLALAVLLIIGNTIRLSIFNRRTEIEINMLFGATAAFIQRPFLYSGLLHGLAGALMAWALVALAVSMLHGPVSDLAGLYASGFRLSGLGAGEIMKLLAGGSLLGLTGSWLAVQRHLRDITPF